MAAMQMGHIERMHGRADETVDLAIDRAIEVFSDAMSAPEMRGLLKSHPTLEISRALAKGIDQSKVGNARFEIKMAPNENGEVKEFYTVSMGLNNHNMLRLETSEKMLSISLLDPAGNLLQSLKQSGSKVELLNKA